MAELNEILHHQNEVTVYCDCSVCLGHPLVGLSACFVGCGSTHVESQKVYTKYIGKTMYAEFLAVKFAIEMLPKMLEKYGKYSYNPTKITVFSDSQVIGDFIYAGAGRKDYMKEVVTEIRGLLESLPDDLDVKVEYIGEHKKQSIFHKASHNAARKAIGKD